MAKESFKACLVQRVRVSHTTKNHRSRDLLIPYIMGPTTKQLHSSPQMTPLTTTLNITLWYKVFDNETNIKNGASYPGI